MLKKSISFCAFVLCAVIFSAGIACAETPLLQKGKKTVYQRVVTHPGAVLHESSDPKSRVVSSPRTFTSMYIYERAQAAGREMLRVGVSAAKSDGWIEAAGTTYWPQAVTMVFTDQMGRQPVLFFKNHDEMVKACEAENIKDYVSQYVELFRTGARLPDDCPVTAVEPSDEKGQVAERSFYLLPVLNMDAQYKESGTRLLEVACIDPGTADSGGGRASEEAAAEKGAQKTAVAIVIDTTISMRPYIEQSLRLVRGVYDALQKSPQKDNMALAVVAFRSSVEKSPGIEYTTKIISDFKTPENRKELETLLSQVREASASTHEYDEDSLAGVKDAVEKLSWEGYSGKAILLVTDSGPIGADSDASKTGMSPEAMADFLRTNRIYLTALHIKTPGGRADHKYAEKSYRALAALTDGKTSYISLDAQTPKKGVQAFDKAARMLTDMYRDMLEATARGAAPKAPKANAPAANASPEEKARYIAETTGYAMYLQFVGNQKGTRAPRVVDAWIADADLASLEANPSAAPVQAVYPAVLLTKTQLSQLRTQLQNIITTAEEAFLQDSENFNFYEQLISAAARMSSDPTQFSADPEANLAKKGVLLEVLDGLPYQSRVLGLKQEDWSNMSTGEQREFIKRLKGLVRRYDEYDRDNAHWESFGAKDRSEAVYRVPLSMLP